MKLGVAKPPTHSLEGSANLHKLARLTPTGRLRMVRRLEAGERLRDVAEAIDLSTTTVRRWWRRYQRAEPGELVHLDIKKLGHFRRVGHRIDGDHGRRTRRAGYDHLHIAIDDRTRLAYAALLPDETAVSAAAFLLRAQRWFATQGVPIQALFTDNGSAYVSRLPPARPAPSADAALLPADQRQGGALHPDLLGGMGRRSRLSHLGHPGERTARCPAILQPGPLPHGPERTDSQAATCDASVNNVFINNRLVAATCRRNPHPQ